MPPYRGVVAAVFLCAFGLGGLRRVLALVPAVASVWMIASTANVMRPPSTAAAIASATGLVWLTVASVFMIAITANVMRPPSTAAAIASATGVVWLTVASVFMIASTANVMRPPSTAAAIASATGLAPLTVACPTAIAASPAIVAWSAAGRVWVCGVVVAAGGPTLGPAMAILDDLV
jgi:hypothetical protein